MAYSSRGGQNQRRSSSQRRPSNQSRNRNRTRSSRDQRSRPRNGTAGTRTRNLTGPDTGYTLHSHRVSYSRRGATMGDRLAGLNGRALILIVLVIVVIVVLITGIASCVNNSSTSTTSQQEEADQTEQKPRVASGLSNDLTQEFNTALDRDDQLAQIAQNADQYDDTRLLELALREPDAISFVANYLTADKSGSSYGDVVTKGQVPLLYDWDARWGYVSYGDGCIGVTGSAPTTVAMAYMGLTGKSDQTPATIAQGTSGSSSTSTSSSGTSGTSSSTSTSSSNSSSTSSNSTSSGSSSTDTADAVMQLMQNVGLSATQYESSSSTLEACLSDSSVAAVYLGDNTLENGSDAHWALVVGTNSDGTLNVFDPTSTAVSTHTWSSATIANASSTILYVTVSETTSDGTDDESSQTQDSEDTSTSSDSSTSSSADSTTNSDTSSSTTSDGGSQTSGTQSGSQSSQSSTGTTSGTTSGSGSNSTSSGSSSTTSTSDSSDYVGL